MTAMAVDATMTDITCSLPGGKTGSALKNRNDDL